MKIINFEQKKMIPLKDKKYASYLNQINCHISKKKKEYKYTNDTTCCKLKIHCYRTGKYRGAAHTICNLKYTVPNNILVFSHKGSNYDYHFIKKELAKDIRKNIFACLFSVHNIIILSRHEQVLLVRLLLLSSGNVNDYVAHIERTYTNHDSNNRTYGSG